MIDLLFCWNDGICRPLCIRMQVLADGNCFFRSIADQVLISVVPGEPLNGFQRDAEEP